MPRSKDKDASSYADPIDYSYWASKPYWSVEEAAALMLDGDLTEFVRASDPAILRTFGTAKQLVAMAQTRGELPRVIQPRIFKAWIDSYSTQGLPPALAKAIDEFQDGPSGIEVLRRQIKQLAEENTALKSKARSEKPVGTRERETLLIMIYSMAKKHYRYNPDAARQDAVKNISTTIGDLGLSISDDTIRKNLQDSAEAYKARRPHSDQI